MADLRDLVEAIEVVVDDRWGARPRFAEGGGYMPNLTLPDVALAARDAAGQAEMHFVRTAHQDEYTSQSVEMLLAEASWLHANEQFADAVPTTVAGAIAKISAVEGLLSDIPLTDRSLEVRHLRAVIRFLQVQTASPSGRRRKSPVTPS